MHQLLKKRSADCFGFFHQKKKKAFPTLKRRRRRRLSHVFATTTPPKIRVRAQQPLTLKLIIVSPQSVK